MSYALPPPTDPEIALSLSYAPPARRAGLAALWALDAQLGATLRQAKDPMVARLRLTWWYEALLRLDTAPPPAQPLLATLAATVLPGGLTGQALAAMTDGWEALLVPDPLSDADLLAFAQGRGRLFALAGRWLDAERAPLAAAGQGWALVDLAEHVRDAETALRARALAAPLLAEALAPRWPMRARALGALAALAERDLRASERAPRGAPARVLRMLKHRITGR
jgi:phytoene synthase